MRPTPILLLVALLAGCPGGREQPDAAPLPCDVTLELSVRDATGTYVPAATATHAQLVQGFQGFRYVYLRGLVGAPPLTPTAVATTQLESEPPRTQILGAVELTPDGDRYLTQALMVFFNDDTLASLVGHTVRLTLRVGDPAGVCQTTEAAEVVLDYDPSCFEGPDGTPVCSDGGMPDGGGA